MKVILFLGLWYIFASVVSTNTSEEPQFPIDSGISKSVACTRLQNLQDNEDFTFSQNGEDGLLLGLLDILGMENSSRTYVEFGVESGVQCNTRILREALGFSGLSMDGGHQNERINLQQEFITEANIISLFEKYSVPGNVDVLSVDVDMFDFWILSRILQNGKYRPRIIIVETNPSLCVSAYKREYRRMNSVPLTVVHPTQTNQTVWDGTRYAGANPRAFQQLGSRYGYDMMYCERCGVNCFLVRRDALPSECQGAFLDRMPQVPYPCFSTLAPDGNPRVGHPADEALRAAVSLSKRGLSQELGQGQGQGQGKTLLEEVSLPGSRFPFDPQTADSDSAGVAWQDYAYACSPDYAGWGQDLWTDLRSWTPLAPLPMAAAIVATEEAHVTFNQGLELFTARKYFESAARLLLLVDELDVEGLYAAAGAEAGVGVREAGGERLLSIPKEVRRRVVLAGKAEKTFGKCQSKHRSEAACVASANCYHNLALALVHTATANSAFTEKEQEKYLRRARNALQVSATYVSNTGTADAEADVAGTMAHFLDFLLLHFPAATASDASASTRGRRRSGLLTQCGRVSLDVTYTVSQPQEVEVAATGTAATAAAAQLVQETLQFEVCTCDSLQATADRFCARRSIQNCDKLYEQMLVDINNQLFDGIPYDLLSVLQGPRSDVAALRHMVQVHRGWTDLPAPFRQLHMLAGEARCAEGGGG